MPKRIQLSRKKGSRKPPEAVTVSRPTKWGNSYRVIDVSEEWEDDLNAGEKMWTAISQDGTEYAHNKDKRESMDTAVDLFRTDVEITLRFNTGWLEPLRGKDLCCWCRLCENHKDGLPMNETCLKCDPCHADVYLEFANK